MSTITTARRYRDMILTTTVLDLPLSICAKEIATIMRSVPRASSAASVLAVALLDAPAHLRPTRITVSSLIPMSWFMYMITQQPTMSILPPFKHAKGTGECERGIESTTNCLPPRTLTYIHWFPFYSISHFSSSKAITTTIVARASYVFNEVVRRQCMGAQAAASPGKTTAMFLPRRPSLPQRPPLQFVWRSARTALRVPNPTAALVFAWTEQRVAQTPFPSSRVSRMEKRITRNVKATGECKQRRSI